MLVGQGEYYNPIFIENGERKELTGYDGHYHRKSYRRAGQSRSGQTVLHVSAPQSAASQLDAGHKKYLEKFNLDLP
ncbi:MAG: hypothetical protein R3C26_07750 [Calditrichia bacterium]